RSGSFCGNTFSTTDSAVHPHGAADRVHHPTGVVDHRAHVPRQVTHDRNVIQAEQLDRVPDRQMHGFLLGLAVRGRPKADTGQALVDQQRVRVDHQRLTAPVEHRGGTTAVHHVDVLPRRIRRRRAAQPDTGGAHDDDPLNAIRDRGAEVVQFFLAAPQGWAAPKPHPQADELRASDADVVIHSRYLVNVASTNNRIRIPSRKLVAQDAKMAAELGAFGLVVHGGHVRRGEDPQVGIDNWRKLFERAVDSPFEVPILVENTAGGDGALAKDFDMLARLWDAIGEFGAGFCLDTCHAYSAGWDLDTAVEKVMSITGR